jgi:nitrite reductase/ring-hydroxylating ferredoxin subunit
MPFTTLCHLDELTENEGKYVEIDGYRLAVFRTPAGVFTLDDACPHAGGSMSAGWVQDGCALCPRHAWAFDLTTGQLAGAGGFTIRTYPVRIHPTPDGRQLVQADLPMP